MGRSKKGAVKKEFAAMCRICAKSCRKGGGLKTHVEKIHEVNYKEYKKCFEGKAKTIIEKWDNSVSTPKGKTVILHIFVRRFII